MDLSEEALGDDHLAVGTELVEHRVELVLEVGAQPRAEVLGELGPFAGPRSEPVEDLLLRRVSLRGIDRWHGPHRTPGP